MIQVASNYPVRGNLKLRTAINDILTTCDQMTEELDEFMSSGNHSKKEMLNFGEYIWYIKRFSTVIHFDSFYEDWVLKEGRDFDILRVNLLEAEEVKSQRNRARQLLNKRVDERIIRFSKIRSRMLLCIYEINDTFTADDLRNAVKGHKWPIKNPSLYNNLLFFEKQGIITKHPCTYTANKFEVE